MDTFLFSKIAKLVGTPTDASWSQVFIQEATEQNISQARGKLFAVLEIKAGSNFPTANTGFEAWEEMATNYFGSDSGGPLTALETSVGLAAAQIENKMKQFTASDQDKNGWQFAVVGAVLWGKVLYLAIVGGAKAQLVRNSTTQTIISSQPKRYLDQAKIQLASGYLEDDDLLVLQSEGFSQAVDQTNLQTATQAEEVNDIVETLAPKIHSLVDSSTIAALFIKLLAVQAPTYEEEGIVFVENNNGQQQLTSQPDEVLAKPTTVQIIQSKIKKILGLIKLKIFTRSASVYLKEQRFDRKKRQKAILTVLAALLVLFAISIFWGLNERNNDTKWAKFNSLYEEASQRYNQGQSLLDLNPGKARENFQAGYKLLTDARLIGIDKDKVKDLESKINDGLQKSLQLVTLDKPTVFLDLGLVKSGAIGSKIAGFEKTLVVWDDNGKSVLKIASDSKSAEVVAGGSELSSGKLVAAGNDFAYVFVPNDGIWRINLRDKTKKKVIDKDNNWGEIVDIYSYAGNIYLLDKAKNQVYKYSAAANGYGPVSGFINSEATRDLSGAQSMTIDGLIWVVSADGKFNKLIGGRVETFEVIGIDKPIADTAAIDGDERAKYLYILDKANKRVLVVTKDGQYWSQYVSDAFLQASDLFVDEPAKKLFVLTGAKILVVDLK